MPLSRWLRPPGRPARANLADTPPTTEAPTSPTRRSMLGHSLAGAALAVLGLTCPSAAAAGTPLPRVGGGRRPGPPARQADNAWMSAKGFCSFPLDWPRDEMPRTGGQLAAALLGGWRDVFTFDNPDNVVDIAGGRYPAIDSLTIDLTGGVANPDRKPVRAPDPVPTTHSLAVRHFTLVGEPLVSQKAKVNFKVTGTDVRFDLQRGKDGRAMLALADAKAGTLHFDATLNDLERLMLAAAQRGGGVQAVRVRAIDLDLESLSERSLAADVHVSTLVGLVPAGVRFTARVDIDERMDARVSHLTCDGDEVLGPLIVGFIRPGMARYEGKSKPLLSFPAGNLKLRDVQVRAGDRVALTAVFSA